MKLTLSQLQVFTEVAMQGQRIARLPKASPLSQSASQHRRCRSWNASISTASCLTGWASA